MADSVLAGGIVNRAIDDWNAVITDQNFDNDNDPLTNDFELTLIAADLGGGGRGQAVVTQFTDGGAGQAGWTVGVPMEATVTLDNNGGGVGWFFDETPLDDAEFTGIADTFQASFVDATALGQQSINDFYRTITHEIGHAMGAGIADGVDLNSGNWLIQNQDTLQLFSLSVDTTDDRLGALTYVGTDQVDFVRTQTLFDPNTLQFDPFTVVNELWQYTLADSTTVTFTESGGGHIYEGPINANTPGADQNLNELMNAGRTVPAGNDPAETTRQFISDLTVEFLADAYGYTVTLPGTLDTAYATLDVFTGTLLVQGSARNFTTGAGVNDTIDVQRVIDAQGDNILVTVNGFTERVPFDQVTDVVIHGNGGTDTITVNANVTQPWQQVDFVVSSNQDALEDANSVGGASITNGIVDLSSVIPGSQTTLRAAIVESNSITAGGSRSIYVGRGQYNLTLSGTGGDTQGDIEVVRHITIVGAGAGATVIDASNLATRDRIFEVAGNSASLNLSKMTLTGGLTDAGGAIKLNNNGTANAVELRLTDVAIVGNTATAIGGGLYLRLDTKAVLTRSVVTDNSASSTSAGGGGIWIDAATNGMFATVVLDRTVVANNVAPIYPDLRSDLNGGAVQGKLISLGGNLITDVSGAYFEGGLQMSDYVSSDVQYVVTSVVDSFDHNDDATALSIREAIDLANINDNVAENIWLPAWDFVLTRDRVTYGNGSLTDMDIAFGDLDISDTLTIRGSGLAGNTSVAWRPGVLDSVFDLLGDYNQDGQATRYTSGSDFLTWQSQTGSGSVDPANWGLFAADGDDDGDVDGDDLTVWEDNYGNTLNLFDVTT